MPVSINRDLTGAPQNTGTLDIGAATSSATAKTTPVDGDMLPISDSAASNVLKKLTWANLKATLGAIVGSTGGTDNALLRADGTGGKTAQASTVTLSDDGEVAGAKLHNYTERLFVATTSGNITLALSNGPVQRITLDAIRQITAPTDPGSVGASITLILRCQSFTPTWSGVTWLTSDGSPPSLNTTSGKRNVIVLIWDDNDGGTGAWLGMLAGKET